MYLWPPPFKKHERLHDLTGNLYNSVDEARHELDELTMPECYGATINENLSLYPRARPTDCVCGLWSEHEVQGCHTATIFSLAYPGQCLTLFGSLRTSIYAKGAFLCEAADMTSLVSTIKIIYYL